MNKKSGVISLNVSNDLEDESKTIGHVFTRFGFYCTSHEMAVLLRLAYFGEYDCINQARVEGEIPCIIFNY